MYRHVVIIAIYLVIILCTVTINIYIYISESDLTRKLASEPLCLFSVLQADPAQPMMTNCTFQYASTVTVTVTVTVTWLRVAGLPACQGQ
jgi:hypothetical protein